MAPFFEPLERVELRKNVFSFDLSKPFGFLRRDPDERHHAARHLPAARSPEGFDIEKTAEKMGSSRETGLLGPPSSPYFLLPSVQPISRSLGPAPLD